MDSKQNVLISCFNNSSKASLPVGLSWAKTLSDNYSDTYNVKMILHGDCIKFGLRSSKYERLLRNLYDIGVDIFICHLCLINDGFTDSDILQFIQPVPFSIDYIIQCQLQGDVIIYDSK
jgi:intracellular sulfur oxidation DsrE/DsrF family protein